MMTMPYLVFACLTIYIGASLKGHDTFNLSIKDEFKLFYGLLQ